jgi:anti-sigma B factor antagonist
VEPLRLEKAEGAGSFRLIGELDASNADEVAARLKEELGRANQLTLDTSDLTFMDSQGLHMLIELGAEAAKRGTLVRLTNSSRQVKRVLSVAVPTGIPGVEMVKESDE